LAWSEEGRLQFARRRPPWNSYMMKLLLAEDDEFSRDMMARRLTCQGYDVITLSNGRVAVAAAREHRPDLILMDLDMPVMDGRAAVRSLKNDVRTFRFPVIALAAIVSMEDVVEAAVEGCCAVRLTKPVLLRRIAEILKTEPE
jgi:two-component system cell cycle response regulator DivK